MLTTSYPRFEGDFSGVFVFRLCEALRTAQIELDVVTSSDNGAVSQQNALKTKTHRFRYFFPRCLQRLAYGEGGGIPENLSRHPWLVLQLPFFLLMFLLKTLQVTKETQVLHANWIYVGGFAWVVSLFRGIPFIVTLRGSDVRLSEQNCFFRGISMFVLKRASLITTVNLSLKEWVVGQGILDQRVRVIRNGVSLPKVCSSLNVGSHCRLIFVGNLVPAKGLTYLVEALAGLALQSVGFFLTVVGDGAQKEQFIRQVSSSGLQDRVTFTGAVPPEQISELMLHSDCLVLPSLSEGTPNVVLEAMACGLPIVASDLPGIREVVTPDLNGLLCEKQDVNALSHALLKIIQNKSLRCRMGKEGRALIGKMRLSWKQTALHYRECYQEVCAELQDSSI